MLGKVYALTITAGATKVFPGGRFLRLISADGPVTLTFYSDDGQPIGEFVDVRGGISIDASEFREKFGKTTAIFGKVEITSATTQTIEVIISRVDVDYDRLTGTIATTSTSGSTITNDAPVTVSATETALIAAGSGRNSVRFRNVGTNPCALIGTGGSFANAAVVIGPGEVWVESDAADAAWFGICGAGLSTTINVQSVS